MAATTDFVMKKALSRGVAKYYSLRGRSVGGKKKKTSEKLKLYQAIKGKFISLLIRTVFVSVEI